MKKDLSVRDIYNEIAATYDRDYFGLYEQARGLALSQIQANLKQASHILDIAVGTGQAAVALEKLLDFDQFIGCDLSEQMIKQAEKNIPFAWIPICGECERLEKLIPADSQDLILSHFLFDYVSPETIIPLCYRLLKPGGYLSIIGSTKKQNENISDIFKNCTISFFIYKNTIKNLVEQSIKKSGIFNSHAEGVAFIEKNNFRIVEEEEKSIPILFSDSNEAWTVVYECGWGNKFLSNLPSYGRWLLRAGLGLLELPPFKVYPVACEMILSSVLVQKPILSSS